MSWTDYHDIVVRKDGEEYRGRYRTDRAKAPGIEVCYGGASKYTLLHASPPDTLARIMMRELIEEQERTA